MRSSMKTARIIALLMALVALFTVVLTSCGETAETFTVTFDADNDTEATSTTVQKGTKITAPADPIKEGYHFRGWCLADTEWNFDGWTVKSDMTLVAKWEEKSPLEAYTAMSIIDARETAKGTKVRVNGVVARITYANAGGQKPNGFILVDETSSIYVFDSAIAGQVKIGNKVEIAAEKDFWILDDEKQNAEKFGYTGSNQLAGATLISNDQKTDNTPDFSWVTENTMKELLNAPFTPNITSLIYKVNALVTKDQQTGFVNYYFNDIDGVTGTYTYTQCNGSDFAWLDQFDGKICTVYITALNAKSTASGCIYRVVPVAVSYDNFVFNTENTPDFVMEYHVEDQFDTVYAGNPKTELITSVSSELLGFEGATVTYTSDNENIVKITVDGGKTILDVIADGKANVTVTVTYGEKSATKTIAIERVKPSTENALNVSEAIAKEVGDTVTVTGIVGPSVVNKDGFYLIDETGVIAVLVSDRSMFDGLKIGNEIILTGKRDKYHNGNGDWAGQTCITGAIIDANLQGNNEYSKETFITGKTATEFYNLDATVDYSTSVFVLEVTVVYHEAVNKTPAKYTLSDGTTEVNLYCSGPDQYAFLSDFVGETVTVEVAACNWNNKTYWRGCVLSVTDADGNTVYNTLHVKAPE